MVTTPAPLTDATARLQGAGSVLVTDSALRTALYVIRSLGRRGVRVTVAERAMPRAEDLGGLSRYVSRRLVVPDNTTEPEAFGDALLAEAGAHDVLFPVGMHSIEVVARRRAEFEDRTRFLLAPWETIARADYTATLLEVATEAGIPQPPRFRLRDHASLEEMARVVTYPAIVKTGIEGTLAPSSRYRRVDGPHALVDAYRALSQHTLEPIVQQVVEGDTVAFEALYDADGREVAGFCHRRLREYPLTGGPSTYCESVRHVEVERLGRRLLEALGWRGLAMVEFKIDRRTGTPMLMEINPRPWGSMALPIRAGTDFPWLWYRLAREGEVEPQPAFRAGVRLRFLVNDVQAVAALVRRPGAGLRARLGACASLLDPRVKEGVLSLDDRAPSAAYLRKALGRLRSGSGPS